MAVTDMQSGRSRICKKRDEKSVMHQWVMRGGIARLPPGRFCLFGALLLSSALLAAFIADDPDLTAHTRPARGVPLLR